MIGIHVKKKLFSELISFIHSAKLNKKATASLLSLLRSTTSLTINHIPKTTNALWQQLGVLFKYKTYNYCSTCFTELMQCDDSCPSCSIKNKPNSELCICSINEELERVVRSNINLIQ